MILQNRLEHQLGVKVLQARFYSLESCYLLCCTRRDYLWNDIVSVHNVWVFINGKENTNLPDLLPYVLWTNIHILSLG